MTQRVTQAFIRSLSDYLSFFVFLPHAHPEKESNYVRVAAEHAHCREIEKVYLEITL